MISSCARFRSVVPTRHQQRPSSAPRQLAVSHGGNDEPAPRTGGLVSCGRGPLPFRCQRPTARQSSLRMGANTAPCAPACPAAAARAPLAAAPQHAPRLDDRTLARPFAALTLMSSAVARFMLSAFGLTRDSADMVALRSGRGGGDAGGTGGGGRGLRKRLLSRRAIRGGSARARAARGDRRRRDEPARAQRHSRAPSCRARALRRNFFLRRAA
jgi:hypothetical protein